MKNYYIYFLTNADNNVLYTGVTNDLARRIYEHKNHLVKGFTNDYNVTKLLYYETNNDVESAIKREKQFKNWHKEWKQNLITEKNPTWKDLFQDIVDPETSSR